MKYDLVFEGGGAKGMVFAGALDELLGRGHTYDRLLGTSAGAITAVLLAAGYDGAEILEALKEKVDGRSVFNDFMGEPIPFSDAEIAASVTRAHLRKTDLSMVPNFIEDRMDDQLASRLMNQAGLRNFFSFVERGGWYSAHMFREWLTARLNSGQFNGSPRAFGSMTLREFHDATGREMSLCAVDVAAQKLLVLNHETAPDCPVVWAARMSMSIPFLWEEVIWRGEWGAYRGREIDGHAVVDGGVLATFPLELFVSDAPHIVAIMGPKRSTTVLGMLIDEAQTVPQFEPAASLNPFGGEDGIQLGDLNTVQRVQRLLNTMLAARDNMVTEAFQHLVVRLPAGGYGTVEFDMSDERRDALVAAGRRAMADYLGGDEASMPSAMPSAPLGDLIDAATPRATKLLAE